MLDVELAVVRQGHDATLGPPTHRARDVQACRQLVLESACAGLRAPFDQVLPTLDDTEQLAAEVALARSLGLRGKLCIHPRQLEPVNTGFGPTVAEVAWARRLVDAFEQAEAAGRGALAVGGEMVDLPVVERARRVLAEAG